jgi:hypothetical protein
MSVRAKKNMYYALAYLCGYIFPFAYFLIRSGLTQEVTRIVFPTVLIGALGVIKLASDIPDWVATWRPSFLKGLVKGIPKFLLFIFFITLGLLVKYVAERQIDLAFYTYFETVLVLFGGLSLGAIFDAFHLKYKELYLISKGYVLGVINK